MVDSVTRRRRGCTAVARRPSGQRMPSQVANVYPFQDSHDMKPISFLGNAL
jgi:hypothetical protein